MRIKFLILFFGLAVLSCKEGSAPKPHSLDGRKIFREHCVSCHGVNGKLGLNGAKDITQSPLSLSDRINLITKGKKVMLSFEGKLSKEEIEAVAKYTFTLE